MAGVKPFFSVIFLSLILSLVITTLASEIIRPDDAIIRLDDTITRPDDAISNPGDYKCVYVVYIRTGSIWKGGTDSIIGLTLYDAAGNGLNITNLEAWGGLMGPGYNYYERGNLDIFSGRGPCLGSPVCSMNLFSDGSGAHHGWYCNYVEVTATGPHLGCQQQLFTVEQWLARDASPYKLYARRNKCPVLADASDGRISSII